MEKKALTIFLIFLSLSFIVTDAWALPSGTWTTKAALPQIRADLPGVAYNGMVYVFGGYHDSWTAGQAEVFAYNPSSDSWTQKTSMTHPRWGSAAAVYNGKAYVFGGRYAGVDSNVVEAYDFASDSWVTKQSLPGYSYPVEGLMAVTVGSLIYIFYRDYAFSYNPLTDTYTQLASAPYFKTWAECAYVRVAGEDRIYILGGYDFSVGGSATCAYYRPAYNDWIYSGSAPYSAYGTLRDDPVINGIIYYGYGHAGGDFYSYLYGFDPNTGVWTQLPSGAYPRDGVACSVVGSKLYVVGGRNADSDPILGLNYNEQFDTGTLTVSIGPTQVRMYVNQSQTFTSSVSGGTPPYTYQWYRNGTAVSGATGNTWTFTPTQTGHYNVYVNVTDNLNNKARSNIVNDILVNNQLSVSISPTSANITLGGSQQFNSTVTGGFSPYTYQWYSNNTAVPNATSSTWTFNPTSTGTYSIYVNVTDNFNYKIQSNTATISVYSQPSVTISPTSVNMTINTNQQFTSNVTGGLSPYSYQWYLNSSQALNATGSTWTFNSTVAGTYIIYLRVTDSLAAVAQSNNATARVETPLTVTISPTQVKMYFGQAQTFSSSVSGGYAPYSYQWYLNDTAVSGATGSTWTFTPRSDGHYKVYLNVTDGLNFRVQSNVVSDVLVGSVYLLLTVEPSQGTYVRGQLVTFTVNVFNQLGPALGSSLTLTVTGPGNYGYFNVQPISVAAGAVGEYSFDWVVPNVAGTYVVEVGLAPSLLTAYDTAWLRVA